MLAGQAALVALAVGCDVHGVALALRDAARTTKQLSYCLWLIGLVSFCCLLSLRLLQGAWTRTEFNQTDQFTSTVKFAAVQRACTWILATPLFGFNNFDMCGKTVQKNVM